MSNLRLRVFPPNSYGELPTNAGVYTGEHAGAHSGEVKNAGVSISVGRGIEV